MITAVSQVKKPVINIWHGLKALEAANIFFLTTVETTPNRYAPNTLFASYAPQIFHRS
jgi:hypothetical protein